MEYLGGAANIAQLLACGHAVSKSLVKLYDVAGNGLCGYRDRCSELRFLLESIQRICIHQNPDVDFLLPLLLGIAELANSLLNTLEPLQSAWRYLLLSARSSRIESYFIALSEKTRMLQLHLAETTHKTVVDVRDIVQIMSKGAEDRCCSAAQEGDNSNDLARVHCDQLSKLNDVAKTRKLETEHDCEGLKLTANGNKAGESSQQQIGTGWGRKEFKSVEVSASNNESKKNAQQAVATAESLPVEQEHHLHE